MQFLLNATETGFIQYLLSIATAGMTFISPCVLPMLPVFVSYFSAGQSSKRRTLINALGFALGLVVVLLAYGAVFSAIGIGLGGLKIGYRWIINLVIGLIVIVLGLSFIGLIKIPFLNNTTNIKVKTDKLKFFSALVFGMVYALSFGACAVAFSSFNLLTAVGDAIETGNILKGIMLQLTFSLTLGLLFVLSAMLIDFLKGFFSFIKRHYDIVNLISGLILIILGMLMATGVMDKIAGL